MSPADGGRGRPAPLADWPRERRAAIRGVFCDIDDTLTTHGRIDSSVIGALERLQAAGLLAVPLTGRPAGWCDMIARQWPVDAVVGENGALAFRYETVERRMRRIYVDDEAMRAEKRRRLQAVRDEILAAVPGVAVAADQRYREADLAIDFREDVAPVPDAIDDVLAIFRRFGAHAKVSSIHVNGWFGDYDKLTMTQRLMAEAWGVDLAAARAQYTFVGDSPNDAPMFAFFPDAIGVANLRALQERCETLPAWITGAERGAGFVEAVDAILDAHS